MIFNIKTLSLRQTIIISVLVIATFLVGTLLYINHEIIIKKLSFLKKDDDGKVVEQSFSDTSSQPKLTETLELIPQKNEEVQLQKQDDNKRNNIYDTQIALYRHYLLEITTLLVNFLQDKPITSQFIKIKTLEMPKEVEDILSDLEEYDAKFLSINDKEKIFPSLRLLETFVKVEKNSENSKKKKALHERIKNNLSLITDYFYSDEFKKTFFSEK